MGEDGKLDRVRVDDRLLRELCKKYEKKDLVIVTNFWDYQKNIKELDPELPGNTLGIVYFDLDSQKEVLQPQPKDPRLRDALKALASLEPRPAHRLLIKKPINGRNTWTPTASKD